MAQYIDKSALLAEIERLIEKYSGCPTRNSYEEGLKGGRLIGYKDALYKINTLEVKDVQEYEQPDYSCFETTYKCGKKPHWNVGDTLAYYEFCSDREGEHVLGKVANVRFDEEQSDWIYTFEGGRLYEEELLLEDETYKKK